MALSSRLLIALLALVQISLCTGNVSESVAHVMHVSCTFAFYAVVLLTRSRSYPCHSEFRANRSEKETIRAFLNPLRRVVRVAALAACL